MLTCEQAFPSRVAGVIRSDEPEAAFHACVAALEGGIGTVEVTMTVPSCFDIVRGLMASMGGGIPIGVGTVLEADAVGVAADAGAAFVVTPAVIPAVADACAREDILCVLGALTPTEVHQARMAGADVVKVFPVQAMGGPDYIRWLRGPNRDADLEARLAILNVPTLVLFGTEDRLIPGEMGRIYREIMPNCHLIYVYDAGHHIDADRPEAFAGMVGDFLERHEQFVVSRASSLINP